MPEALRNAFIGIDAGTSGMRACLIDEAGKTLDQRRLPDSGPAHESPPQRWKRQLFTLLGDLSANNRQHCRIRRIAIDGTSGTLLACDHRGQPLAPVKMYHEVQQRCLVEHIARHAPPDNAALSATSSLARALALKKDAPDLHHLCHQADWLAGLLTGNFALSDENNCLKMGYDIQRRAWPDWLFDLGLSPRQLPVVYPPGQPVSPLLPDIVTRYGLADDCQLVAGTTDSIAATIATGIGKPGEAVTSLGSTLVLKLLSTRPVESREYGIYSHRFGELWLVGGASNTGGAVLRRFFSQAELDAMTPRLDFSKPTGRHYYPLPSTGERFPVNDPEKPPELTPRPEDDQVFYQAILEAISRIEQRGYQKLVALGASPLDRVLTCGGGSHNEAWRHHRQTLLNRPVEVATNTEACFGAALLARRGYQNTEIPGNNHYRRPRS